MSRYYQDINLDRAECRYNVAKGVHDELENALAGPSGKPLRTFFDIYVAQDIQNDDQKDEGVKPPAWKSLET